MDGERPTAGRPRHVVMEANRRQAGISYNDLWLCYFSLTGDAAPLEGRGLPPGTHAAAAHAAGHPGAGPPRVPGERARSSRRFTSRPELTRASAGPVRAQPRWGRLGLSPGAASGRGRVRAAGRWCRAEAHHRPRRREDAGRLGLARLILPFRSWTVASAAAFRTRTVGQDTETGGTPRDVPQHPHAVELRAARDAGTRSRPPRCSTCARSAARPTRPRRMRRRSQPPSRRSQPRPTGCSTRTRHHGAAQGSRGGSRQGTGPGRGPLRPALTSGACLAASRSG